MPDPWVIETIDLRKSYGSVPALRGLSLEVPAGSIYALLGRNGAGKTTAIKVLLGMTRPTAGTARVFGRPADDPRSSIAIRRRTAFVGEDLSLHHGMTVDHVLRFTASFYPRWQDHLAAQYLRTFGLEPGHRVKTLSRGMRTKLALLLALCRGAELLILDEPTIDLDPEAVEEVLQAIVRHVASEQATVLLASHQIAQVEQIADRVAIVDQGRVLAAGLLEDLDRNHCRVELVFSRPAPYPVFRSSGVLGIQREGRVLIVVSSRGPERIIDEARRLSPVSVSVAPMTLKEIFLGHVLAEERCFGIRPGSRRDGVRSLDLQSSSAHPRFSS